MVEGVRLAFTSDLHVDHHPEVVDRVAAAARAARADVLVVAGDVTPRPERLGEALRRLSDAAPTVAFVPGNHDLWCADDHPADSRERYLEVIPEICESAGVACLPDGPLDLGVATLVGQTGWYDFSLRDPAHDVEVPFEAYRRGRYGRLTWTDKHFVRWAGCEDDVALAAWMTERLACQIAAVRRDRPIVVTTHMVPFAELVTRRPLPWGFVTAFLGAARLGDAIVSAARGGAPVVYAIAGHTHDARRALIEVDGGRTLVAETSPIGYPREYRHAGDIAARVAARLRVIEL